MNRRVYNNTRLSQLLDENKLSESSKLLFELQCSDWLLCKNNYQQLNNIKVKEFRFNNFKIKAQFNPGRIVSTAAKVDPESIKERKCFLCEENLPEEQKWILYRNSYSILINPFPIFPIHLTIAKLEHRNQRIIDSFVDLLKLSKDLSEEFTIIYNGPKCGASAPDHLHFQAGNKYFMPIDDEADLIANEFGTIIKDNEDIIVLAVNDGLRKFLLFESFSENLLLNYFDKFYNLYSDFLNQKEEPLMNIISFYDNEIGWRIIIFLRSKHRSNHFFQQGDNKIMVSPAAIDLGGVCIFPRKIDFEKVNLSLIQEIFSEVFIDKITFDNFVNKLSSI